MSGRHIAAESVDLIFTSPPFALTRPKDYGNRREAEYLDWFESFVPGFERVLKPSGSLVIDIGGAYLPGRPVRSTYHFELAVRLARRLEFCQELFWYNPAKLPSPAEYTNVRRSRVKDSVNLLLWFAKDANLATADSRRVLRPYSDSMKALLRNGYQAGLRPSNHDISDSFLRDNQGSIPSNVIGYPLIDPDTQSLELRGAQFDVTSLLPFSNTASSGRYLEACRRLGVKPHTARFPDKLPMFFIQFLTDSPTSVIFDPFAGSNTTGAAAESLGRRWISCDLDAEGPFAGTYVRSSAFRFENPEFSEGDEDAPKRNWTQGSRRATPKSRSSKKK